MCEDNLWMKVEFASIFLFVRGLFYFCVYYHQLNWSCACRKSISQFKIAIKTLANKWDAKLFPQFLVMWSPALGNLQDRDVAHLFHAAERGSGVSFPKVHFAPQPNLLQSLGNKFSFSNSEPLPRFVVSVPSRNLPFEKAVRTKLENSGLRENKWFRYIILSSWFTRAYWWVRPILWQVNWYPNFAGALKTLFN